MTPPAPISNPILAVVNIDRHRLRAAPGLAAAIIRELHKGEAVAVSGGGAAVDNYVWLRCDTAAGEQGYAAQYVGGVDAFLPAKPTTAPAEIIDVSEAQGVVDWHQIAASGVKLAIIRASQGTAQTDARFHANIDGAEDAGLDVACYHALIASADGKAQSANFLKTVGLFRNDLPLPLIIDVELTNGMKPAQIADTLFGMATALEAATGAKPMIYTTAGFFNALGAQHDAYFAQCPLWVANWRTSGSPILPRCWHDYALWQYSSDGHVDGIKGRVDLSRKR